jgi:hypothetical protein
VSNDINRGALINLFLGVGIGVIGLKMWQQAAPSPPSYGEYDTLIRAYETVARSEEAAAKALKKRSAR